MVKKANIEAAISNAVLDWVNTNYPEVIITTTQNESNFGNRKQVGSLGITDLILFTRKDTVLCVLFLELKTAGLHGPGDPLQSLAVRGRELKLIRTNGSDSLPVARRARA